MFQPVLKRTAIVVAGPLANFVLAIVIFACVFMLYGKQTMSARVDTVQPGSAAAAAGFQAWRSGCGDRRPPIDRFRRDAAHRQRRARARPLDYHR